MISIDLRQIERQPTIGLLRVMSNLLVTLVLCPQATLATAKISNPSSGEKKDTPGGIRTPDRRIRNPLLYPAELQALMPRKYLDER